jgi:hypothetical protein
MKFDAEERQQFADQWMQWWAEHADSRVDLGSIDAVRYDGDVVAAVATATMPHLFPNGPQVHLSEVHEADIGVPEFLDVPGYLNLSIGKPLCRFEDVEGKTVGPNETWFREAGIDVTCNVRMSNSKNHPPPPQVVAEGFGMKTWRIDNSRFDTIEEEVRGAAPILHDAKGPGADIVPEADAHGMFQYPATFLIQTSKNQFGILQAVGPIPGEDKVRIRYRLWQDASGATQPVTTLPSTQSVAALLPAGAKFGEAHEVTLFNPASGQPAGLNLKTGKIVPQTVDVSSTMWTKAKLEWAKKSEVDLSALLGGSRDGSLGLIGLTQTSSRLVSVPVSDEAWDQMSPQTCSTIAGRVRRARRFSDRQLDVLIRINEKIPGYSETWLVSSANSADVIGLVQILDVQPTQLKLRYKLVEVPPEK